jgi:hypothetical protein
VLIALRVGVGSRASSPSPTYSRRQGPSGGGSPEALPSFFVPITYLPGSSLAYDPSANVRLSTLGAYMAGSRPTSEHRLLLYQRRPPPFAPGSYGLGEEEATSAVENDRLIVLVGALVALAVVALAAYVVTRLSSTGPAVAAGVLTAVAAVLAVIPAIIKALRGR